MEDVSNNEFKKYEEKAIWLETFIAGYVPAGWKEPIGSVMPRFRFSAEDIISMEDDFRNGKLEIALNEKYENPHVRKAILEFLLKNVKV